MKALVTVRMVTSERRMRTLAWEEKDIKLASLSNSLDTPIHGTWIDFALHYKAEKCFILEVWKRFIGLGIERRLRFG